MTQQIVVQEGTSTAQAIREWVAASGGLGAAIAAALALRSIGSAERSAKAGELSANASERSSKSQVRPFLIDVPYEQSGVPGGIEVILPDSTTRKTPMRGEISIDAERGLFSVPLRNVGQGVAKLVGAELIFKDAPSQTITAEGFVRPYIPVGEEGRVGAYRGQPTSRAETLAMHFQGGVELAVTYSDYLGEQVQTLRMSLGSYQETSWRVLSVHHG